MRSPPNSHDSTERNREDTVQKTEDPRAELVQLVAELASLHRRIAQRCRLNKDVLSPAQLDHMSRRMKRAVNKFLGSEETKVDMVLPDDLRG